MKKTEIDYWIAAMLESHSNVSDLNITVGKSLQVESAGQLVPVDVVPPVTELTPFQAEAFALNLIGNNRRLLKDLVENGSCDLSYSLSNKARFRVNVFTQKGIFYHRAEKAGNGCALHRRHAVPAGIRQNGG